MTALEVRLRVWRIVVTAKHEVVEVIRAREVDEALVRIEILRAAPHPIREGFLRDELLEERVLLLLAARESLDLRLVLEHGVAEDIRAVVPIVARLLVARGLAGARRAHDGAEDVERELRILLAERREPLRTRENLLLRVLVLARADETAVEHGVRGNNGRPGILGVLIEPLPELVWMTEVLTVAEQIFRRHDYIVAELLDGGRRLFVRNRPVVVRDEDDLVRRLFLVARARAGQRGEQHAEQHAETSEPSFHRFLPPFLSYHFTISSNDAFTSSGTSSRVSKRIPPSCGVALLISIISSRR